MARVDLTVPFQDKDHAKALGARWDPERKVWYVPDGMGRAPFLKWDLHALEVSLATTVSEAQSHAEIENWGVW